MSEKTIAIDNVMKIQVPLSVLLSEKYMAVHEILDLAPGSVITFDKNYESTLQLLANGQEIATGVAVKVNEKFGLQVKEIGSREETINALGGF